MPKRKRKTESKEDSKNKSKKKFKNKSNSAEKDETIKYMGVTKRVSGRFKAQVSVAGKYHALGMFDTPREAAEAHDRARIKARHPLSKLNFPNQVPKNYNPKKKKLRSTNTIGFRGVSKYGKRYTAYIHIDDKKVHIGQFDTAKAAAIAYDSAAIQAKRPTSDLNFPGTDTGPTKKLKVVKPTNITSLKRVHKKKKEKKSVIAFKHTTAIQAKRPKLKVVKPTNITSLKRAHKKKKEKKSVIVQDHAAAIQAKHPKVKVVERTNTTAVKGVHKKGNMFPQIPSFDFDS